MDARDRHDLKLALIVATVAIGAAVLLRLATDYGW